MKGIKSIFKLIIVLSLALTTYCSKVESKSEGIRVFAAASLGQVMSALSQQYEKEKRIKISLNFASSGTLARQIEQGASADLFISASKVWVDHLEENDQLNNKTKLQVKNNLVLIAPIKSPFPEQYSIDQALDDFSGFEGIRLAMGDPNHVPAGVYGQEALTHFGWFEKLRDRLLLTKDVRATLSLVELSEVALGIVYESEARSSAKIRIIDQFPEEAHSPIHYFAGLGRQTSEASNFMTFINSPDAQDIWLDHGFTK